MQERRKSKRSELQSTLIMKRLDAGNEQENNIVSIDIQDISKTGVGFFCKEILQIGAIYEAYLTIWTKEVLHAFLQIARIELHEQDIFYGASFVGLPEVDANRIGTYQIINDDEK